MKRVFYLFAMAVCCMFAACSDSDDYNANTAESPYKPSPTLRKVASVRTTNTVDGRDYSWEHKFEYDAQGRIKSINSTMQHHRAVSFADVVRYYKCDITSRADYYYKGDVLEVDYVVERNYPEYPDWNTRESGSDRGKFNQAGVLSNFATIDFVYSATSLSAAYTDSGREYLIKRDASGDVSGYVITNLEGDSIILDRGQEYGYSRFQNRINFDLSAYFGYWGIEQELYANRAQYYASYQLGAFGMLGAASPYLPISMLGKDEYGNSAYIYGEWELDSQNCPVSFTDATGRKSVITYVE